MNTNTLYKKVAQAFLLGLITTQALSAASTTTENSPLSVASSTTVTTTPPPFVKKVVSKLADIPDEKKNANLETPLGNAAFTLYNKLIYSSSKTEATLKKLDDFLTQKESLPNHIDTSKARFSYDIAKSSLENANTSLTQMSSILEKWVGETSTTTFKKAVGVKKSEFKNQAETTKTSIKSANEAIKASVMAYKASEKEFENQTASSTIASSTPKDQTIFDLGSSTQKNTGTPVTLPISEVTKTLKQ